MHFGNISQVCYGLNISVKYNFHDSSRYSLFVMFKHNGNVITKRVFIDVRYNPLDYLLVYGLYMV